MAKKCIVCGSDIKKYGKRFCSQECYKTMASQVCKEAHAKNKKPPVELPCKNCGLLFVYNKRKRREFCSRECVGEFVGKIGSKRIHNPPAKIICKHCHKEFYDYHRDKKFCSRQCASKGREMPKYSFSGSVDQNQSEIVEALRKVGASVLITSSIGKGFPDLVVGYKGQNYLIEVKNLNNAYGRKGFRKSQQRFYDEWQGSKPAIATCINDALDIIGFEQC